MKVSKVRECRAVLTDTLELRFCRVCGAYSRFSTIAAVTQPDLRAASTIWWAYFTITLWSPDLCKAVILDVGWSTIQSQFLRKPYSRLGWIRTWGKFGQNKEWGCYLNKSYSIQRTILFTYISWKFCNQQTKFYPETTLFWGRQPNMIFFVFWPTCFFEGLLRIAEESSKMSYQIICLVF